MTIFGRYERENGIRLLTNTIKLNHMILGEKNTVADTHSLLSKSLWTIQNTVKRRACSR